MSFVSIGDVFKIAIGPSSSHTLGALKSGLFFRKLLAGYDLSNAKIRIELRGSFALTGKGHLTDKAAVCGLNGMDVEKEGENFLKIYNNIAEKGYININSVKIPFDVDEDIVWNKSFKGISHPNSIKYILIKMGKIEIEKEYHSIGGGMLEFEKELKQSQYSTVEFENLTDVMDYCKKHNMDFAGFIDGFEDKKYGLSKEYINDILAKRWGIMKQRIDKGLKAKGTLPGALHFERRASKMFNEYLNSLRSWRMLSQEITLTSIYAIAVAEENANGAVIVTAPTCGSSGVLPAVLRSIQEKYHLENEKIIGAMKVAGLIAAVVIKNGSISGAQVGCQGEIGVACAMAAASACYLMGGGIKQIEFAAEIGLEHHLGLTCDPVAGLVQIPCIERNGAAAVSALNAANLSLLSRGNHQISFDNAVATMMEIGKDMSFKYKETALGGLANIYKPQ